MFDEILKLERNLSSLTQVAPKRRFKSIGQALSAGLVLWCTIMVMVPWQQTSMGSGRVVAYSPTERQQHVDAPVEGKLVRWFVHEGSHVEEGDPIVEISDNDPDLLNRLQVEKDAIQARLNAAQVSKETALINLNRQKSLSEQGLSSRRSFELAKLEHAKYLTDEANTRMELMRIDTRLARQSTQFVRAPRSGSILRRMAGESSVLVKTGEHLLSLVPDTDSRAAEVWIPGNDVSLIHRDQVVRLQFEGWPAMQFSGWPSVSTGTFAGRVAVIDAADSGDGKFRILIIPEPNNPWPSSQYLRQGVRVHAWILLGRVKLGYELWRKFNGFPPAMEGPPQWMKKSK